MKNLIIIFLNLIILTACAPNLSQSDVKEIEEYSKSFLVSLSNSNIEQIGNSCSWCAEDNKFLNIYSSLKVVNIGKPYTSFWYMGVHVPYTIELKNGETKKHNLAIKRNQKNKKWYHDGGL